MKAKFTTEQIQKTVDDFAKQKEEEIIAELYYLGVQYVNSCKTNGNYKNRTGNLRSSIGCAVLKDGEIVKAVKYGDSEEGVIEGSTMMEEIKSLFPKGYFLVVYAGMHYAIYVESLEAYSVITSWLPDSDQFIQDLKSMVA